MSAHLNAPTEEGTREDLLAEVERQKFRADLAVDHLKKRNETIAELERKLAELEAEVGRLGAALPSFAGLEPIALAALAWARATRAPARRERDFARLEAALMFQVDAFLYDFPMHRRSGSKRP
jgi:hypothetical protein